MVRLALLCLLLATARAASDELSAMAGFDELSAQFESLAAVPSAGPEAAELRAPLVAQLQADFAALAEAQANGQPAALSGAVSLVPRAGSARASQTKVSNTPCRPTCWASFSLS